MASNEQSRCNTTQDTRYDPTVLYTGTNDSLDLLSLPPLGIHEKDPLTLSHNSASNQLDDELTSAIHKISHDLNIRSKMAEFLRQLRHFEIVIVCDDSGSMKTLVDDTQRTRWDELCEIVKIVIRIGVIFDPNGVDIYFLNRGSYQNVRDPKTVNKAFEKPPSGYTPLVRTLREVFKSKLAAQDQEKKLLVFVATDGLATDDNGNDDLRAFEHVMNVERQKDTTYVSFLLCTDESDCVNYMRDWDRQMDHVDVTDDFRTETARIRECQKRNSLHIPHGDYIVKALVGAIDPEFDKLNESSRNLFTKDL